MKYFLAIDIGASSGRHILGWREGGAIRTEEIYRFRNGAERRDGRLVWDTERLFSEILAGLKRAKELGKVPACVGVDTWAVDYALLDEADEPVGPVYCYRDGRTQEAVRAVHDRIPFEDLYARTGIQFQPFNTVYQLYADKLSGRLARAASFLMLPDYINFRLTGVKRQEYTNATSTGMVNARSHAWDGEILSALAFPPRMFGELALAGTPVGPFRKAVEEEVGYSARVMLPATHDTASAVLAAPMSERAPYISSGTWSLLGIEQETAHTDGASRAVNFSNEGSLGYTFRYQKNIMGLWMIQSVKRELGDGYSFPDLAALARTQERGALVDVNDGRFLAPESMIAAIDGAVGRKLSLAERMRIVYDSLAESYRLAIGELERGTGGTYETLHIFGGGARDEFLCRLTAEATGKRVIAGPVEATAIGNLVVQMMGAGELADLQEARGLIGKSFDIKEIL